MRLICIIPARAGSKGIPNKNLHTIADRPLIDWSIIHAMESGIFDEVVVSSDGEHILDRAKKYGVTALKRPAELATDQAPTEPTLLHAMEAVGVSPADIVVLLQPTSPLRTPQDLIGANDQFQSEQVDSLFTSSRAEDRFLWKHGASSQAFRWESVTYDWRNRKRRQDMSQTYLENGSFYFTRASLLKETQNRLGGVIGNFVMPIWKAPQIDAPPDLEIVELLMVNKLLKEWQPTTI